METNVLTPPRSRWRFRLPSLPPWLWAMLGLVGILVLELILFAHVTGRLQRMVPVWGDLVGRFVRVNMTPFAWCLYLMFLVGLLGVLDGQRSWLRRWRWRFIALWLWSVVCWCYFDWMNFYFMRDPVTGQRSWEYLGIPPAFSDRLGGYLIAFGTICPGMFLTAEVYSQLWRSLQKQSCDSVSAPSSRPSRAWTLLLASLVFLGIILCAVPIFVGTAISNLALWLGTFCLLDPINHWAGRPSILGDWRAGRWGRTVSLWAGGLTCGFLWEFWNYWALTKWVYHLPFLGAWEQLKYFEMPVPGLAGFIAFGVQTWVMWQTTLLLLSPFVEGEGSRPADLRLHREGCF